MDSLADRAEVALAAVVAQLPGGGEARPGQVQMARAVADALEGRRHLAVQAGTGTGKSLAYLVPAVLSGQRLVVATATKALQDQLACKDLPFLLEHLDQPFRFAVVKGRSNYLCRQRAAEQTAADGKLALDDGDAPQAEIEALIRWGDQTDTGDRGDLPVEPSPKAWAALSVSARECPGASKCPKGDECFAELNRLRASAADIIVVNTHLYGLDLAAGGGILPEHDAVVVDEAHQLEDVVSATFGLELGGGRLIAVAQAVTRIVADDRIVSDLYNAATTLGDVLEPERGNRITATDGPLGEVLDLVRSRLADAAAALRKVPDTEGDVATRKQRAQRLVTALTDDVDRAAELTEAQVAWVEGPPSAPAMRVAPVDVRELLQTLLWDERSVVLTSATLAPTLPERLAAPPDDTTVLDVGSPFDYRTQSILYVARHLPDPRSHGWDQAMQTELRALIRAAGGRTMALFTSWRAMTMAADALENQIGHVLLRQGQLPKRALLEAFTEDETSCLFATMSFWQGVDIPGAALSLVVIDKLPFARPNDPLMQARRDVAGATAFMTVDIPLAATLLAQGVGRLIRTATDRGVVAVCDPRLARARYRSEILSALPPMKRSVDRSEVAAFLAGAKA